MKTLLLGALLLASTASLSSAAGLNMAWLDCGGAVTRTFLCNTNSGGGHTLVGTFVAPAGLTKVTGWAAIIDLQTAGATLSPWWELGGCRPSGASHSADFTGGPFTCTDYFATNVSGAGVFILPPNSSGPNRARMKEGWAYGSTDPNIRAIDVNTEVYAWKCTINNTKTAGLGACSGCSSQACIVYNEILVTQTPGTPGGDALITNTATSSHVIWQAWTDVINTCPAITPAVSRTWGSIKAIYR